MLPLLLAAIEVVSFNIRYDNPADGQNALVFKNIVYSEALTDTQWLKLVDGGADHEEIAVADRQKRRRRASNGNGA